MTQEQAKEVAAALQERLHPGKIWSITVCESRRRVGVPPRWRVVIHAAGGSYPIAIYGAAILSKPIEVEET